MFIVIATFTSFLLNVTQGRSKCKVPSLLVITDTLYFLGNGYYKRFPGPKISEFRELSSLCLGRCGKRPEKVVLSPKLLVAVTKLFSDLKTAYLKNYSNEDKRY